MLGKLLKYEFKATGRTFIPLYIAIIVVAFLNGMFFDVKSMTAVQGIGILVLGALFIALGVLTIVVTVQRFNRNLLGDEGYLMFTLPVTPKMLIISKVIVSTVWFILSGITAMISFIMLGLITVIKSEGFKDVDFQMFWDSFFTALRYEDFHKAICYMLGLVGLMLLSYIIFTLVMYLSLSIGQLSIFNNFKKLAPFISFFVINFIINAIGGYAIDMFNDTFDSLLLKGYIVCIALVLILFFPTSYILEKKLNIE